MLGCRLDDMNRHATIANVLARVADHRAVRLRRLDTRDTFRVIVGKVLAAASAQLQHAPATHLGNRAPIGIKLSGEGPPSGGPLIDSRKHWSGVIRRYISHANDTPYCSHISRYASALQTRCFFLGDLLLECL